MCRRDGKYGNALRFQQVDHVGCGGLCIQPPPRPYILGGDLRSHPTLRGRHVDRRQTWILPLKVQSQRNCQVSGP
ncbi:hypothetical protein Kisp02_08030 [Kineosporia sp. NBRC 101731]|nr:hypothetical protein Kisp02_08030 [Kineosporia sp. NBRC 101731]